MTGKNSGRIKLAKLLDQSYLLERSTFVLLSTSEICNSNDDVIACGSLFSRADDVAITVESLNARIETFKFSGKIEGRKADVLL